MAFLHEPGWASRAAPYFGLIYLGPEHHDYRLKKKRGRHQDLLVDDPLHGPGLPVAWRAHWEGDRKAP
jgi:hypothetical protein